MRNWLKKKDKSLWRLFIRLPWILVKNKNKKYKYNDYRTIKGRVYVIKKIYISEFSRILVFLFRNDKEKKNARRFSEWQIELRVISNALVFCDLFFLFSSFLFFFFFLFLFFSTSYSQFLPFILPHLLPLFLPLPHLHLHLLLHLLLLDIGPSRVLIFVRISKTIHCFFRHSTGPALDIGGSMFS